MAAKAAAAAGARAAQLKAVANVKDPNLKLVDAAVRDEYHAWKGNACMLYDHVVAHDLKWPSLTVKWLPDPVEKEGCVVHRLVIGTHASPGQQNHVNIAEVSFYDADSTEDDELGFKIVQSLNHPGDVNRAAYNPYNPQFIGTKTPSGDVLVYDLSKHPLKAPAGGAPNAQATLSGHTKEGYGLEWCPKQNGILASGADDGVVCVWDLDVTKSHSQKIDAQTKLDESKGGHTDVVEDVSWSSFHPKVLASCGDDGFWMQWDLRTGDKPALKVGKAHGTAYVNSIACSPLQEHLVVTGGADGAVNLWDTRKLSSGKRMHALEGHSKEVQCVTWSPDTEGLLASCGQDCRVYVWDLSKIGQEMTAEELQDGPPELAFIHSGHCANVPEVAWGRDCEWTMASVAEDNIIQVWSVNSEVWDDGESDNGGEVE